MQKEMPIKQLTGQQQQGDWLVESATPPPRTGSFGGIRLYMTELIAITQMALQSQSWKMKAQGAAAMATVAREQTGSLVAPHLGMVLTALMQGLSGRTWAGKVLYCERTKQSALVSHGSYCLWFSGGAAEGHRISGRQMLVSVDVGISYISIIDFNLTMNL